MAVRYNPGQAWTQGAAARSWTSPGDGTDHPWDKLIREGVAERTKLGARGPGNTIYQANIGKYVDPKTGADFTGWVTGYGGEKIGYARAGVVSGKAPTAAESAAWSASQGENPDDAFPKLRTTVEQPEVADFAKAGLKAAPGQMDKTMTAFDQLLENQRKETASMRESAPAAYDTSGTEAELRGANTRFEESSGDVLGRMEKNMADYKARQNEIQGQKGAELGVYEKRAQDVADLALAHGTARQNAAMVSAGGNQGWSGAATNRANRLYRDINTPLQRELSLRRTGLLGEAGSLEREYLGNENAVLSLNQSLNEAFRGNTVATAQYIQNLRSQMRNMSAAEQDNLLRREAETLGLGQKLRSGEITTAGLLAALERSATNYSYTQPFDESRVAGAAGYSPAPLPSPSPQPQPGNPNPNQQPNTTTGTPQGRPGIDRPATAQEMAAAREEHARQLAQVRWPPPTRNYAPPVNTGLPPEYRPIYQNDDLNQFGQSLVPGGISF